MVKELELTKKLLTQAAKHLKLYNKRNMILENIEFIEELENQTLVGQVEL